MWWGFLFSHSSVVTRGKSLLLFYGFEPLSWTLLPGLDHLLDSRALWSNYSAPNSHILYPVLCSEKKTQLPLQSTTLEGASAAGSLLPNPLARTPLAATGIQHGRESAHRTR